VLPDQEQTNTPDAVARRWSATFNAHDAVAIVALYREDAELFDSGMKRPCKGRGEIARWFRWRFSSTPTISYTAGRVQSMGDGQVVVNWIVRGRGPRIFGINWLERPFQVDGESVFKVHDGLIEQQRGRYDHLLVLRQIIPALKWLPAICATMVYAIYMWRKGPRG